MKNQGLTEAAKAAGGVEKLAKELHVTRFGIHYWDRTHVPLKRMFEIEKKFKVSRELLRPDIFKR